MTDSLTRRAPRQPLLQVKTTLTDRFRIQTRDTRHPLGAAVTDDLGKQPSGGVSRSVAHKPI